MPFAVVGFLGLTAALLPPHAGPGPQLVLAMAITVAVLTLQTVVILRTHRSWLDPVPAWVFFFAFVVLRDTSGGSASGLAPLVALPICWLVLFGTRRELAVAAGLTLVSFVGPLVLVGGPAYPVSDWRRALLWSAFALLIAPMMQAAAHELIRRRQEERLLSSQLEGLMRNATLSSVIATGVDGTITTFSPGAERLLGYRADEMIGRHDPGIFHDPREVSAVAVELGVESGFAVFAELARRDSPSRIWSYLRHDATRIFVRLAITELRDHDGTLSGYLGVAIDSTDAVESQRELAAAEARWRSVMSRLADTTVLVLTDDMQVELVAGAGAVAVGIGDGAGRNLREFSSPANVDVLSTLVADAAHGIDARAELRSTANGSEQDVYVTQLPGAVGEPDRVLLLARDVGAARARERALERERARADRIFEMSLIPMALLDRSQRVVSANSALASLLGTSADDVTGRPLHEIAPFHVALSEHVERHFESAASSHHTEISVSTESGQRHLAVSTVFLGGEHADEVEILIQLQDVTERRLLEADLSHLADHDPLTGLANRRRFDRTLTGLLETQRTPAGAVVLIDLDHFKEVNDVLGHAAGDDLLVEVAHAIRSTVRSTDTVARLGGDEFALLLPDIDAHGAAQVCDAVLAAVRATASSWPAPAAGVSASAGLCMMADADPEALLQSADAAMYEAKTRGRGRLCMAGDPWPHGPRVAQSSGRRATDVDRQLAAAMDEGRLELHLQPILDLAKGRVVAAEGLLRLREDERDELVLPGEFIPAAEKSGFVREVDAWAVREAVRALAELKRHDPEFVLSVNLSGKSLGRRELGNALTEALATHDVRPRDLVLEVTETAAADDLNALATFADIVRQLGCRTAVDDFGTGHGAFHYLWHLDADFVKIDGRFVATSDVVQADRRILQSTVAMSRQFGARTIAEFVNSAAVLEVCRADGVDLVQGHFIGRAVPLGHFLDQYV